MAVSLHGGAEIVTGTVFFVGVDTARCAGVAEAYSDQGWETPMGKPDDFDLVDRLIEDAPVAAVFCTEPEHVQSVWDLTQRLMSDTRFERPLMVYLDADPEWSARIKEICPYGVFVSSGELGWVLKHLIAKS
jgi:hypothetical protein